MRKLKITILALFMFLMLVPVSTTQARSDRPDYQIHYHCRVQRNYRRPEPKPEPKKEEPKREVRKEDESKDSHKHCEHKNKKSHAHKHKKCKHKCKKCQVAVAVPVRTATPVRTGCVSNCATNGYAYQYPAQPRYIVANSPSFVPSTGYVNYNPFAPNGAKFQPSNPFPVERSNGVVYYQNSAPIDYYANYQQ
jgi:hypothetical protein